MKKYTFILLFLVLALMPLNAYSGTQNVRVERVRLYFQDGTYQDYDVNPNVAIAYNNDNSTYSNNATFIVTLTDTSNSLPASVITQIKFYGTYTDLIPNQQGWLGKSGVVPSDDNYVLNLLNTNLDLSDNKRKKITVRITGGGGSGNDAYSRPQIEENL